MNKIQRHSLSVICVAVLLSGCTVGGPAKNSDVSKQGDQASEESFSGTMRDLMNRGKSVQCEWMAKGDGDDVTKGSLYISGKKFRQIIKSESTDPEIGNMEIEAISDGEYMYTWNSKDKQNGMKMKLDEAEETADSTAKDAPKEQQVNIDNKFDYKCKNWNADQSMFTAPSGVNFVDLSEMMKGFQDKIKSSMPSGMPSISIPPMGSEE